MSFIFPKQLIEDFGKFKRGQSFAIHEAPWSIEYPVVYASPVDYTLKEGGKEYQQVISQDVVALPRELLMEDIPPIPEDGGYATLDEHTEIDVEGHALPPNLLISVHTLYVPGKSGVSLRLVLDKNKLNDIANLPLETVRSHIEKAYLDSFVSDECISFHMFGGSVYVKKTLTDQKMVDRIMDLYKQHLNQPQGLRSIFILEE